MRTQLINFINAFSGSYGQVFFSVNKLFALFLLAASFLDPYSGTSGLIAVLFTLLVAKALGLNPVYIQNGSYSFNSLLTGLALGAYFKFTGNFIGILLFASLFALLITVWLSAVTSRHQLPFLSLPFVFTVWIIFLNARSFDPGLLQLRSVNELNGFWGDAFSGLTSTIQNAVTAPVILVYLKTMAAVFFQNNIISGILIVIGLLFYSRIAFVLSLVGFFSGYLYFKFTHSGLNELNYQLVACSYILSALGLGGFYLIASPRSFLLVIISAPIIGLLADSLDKIMFVYNLPIYSLPFSIAVIIILSVIHQVYLPGIFQLVQVQQFSPEKNLYAFRTYVARFKNATATIIHLPFFGEWTVSQGHDGKMTHKNDWRYAWDFVVKDEHKRTFKLPGKTVTDFFCYGLPVLAPADGQVVTVEDGIDDNEIGKVNLAQNWGNTVIIKHSEFLYSKLSHLKKGSFKIKPGDSVKKGEIVALCGNSGRSPEPHIHFQLQRSEVIGAASIDYPIGYYARKIFDSYQFNVFDVPAENETLVRPVAAPLLKKAFNFNPGTKFNFEVNESGNVYHESWEVFSDDYNNAFIQCQRTNARAYFKSDDTLFYFTGFKGCTKSILYAFYLGAYKVLLSPFKNLKITDRLSIEATHRGLVKVLQDLIAPFCIFIQPRYSSTIMDMNNEQTGARLTIISKVRSNFSGKNIDFEIEVAENKIQEIKITEKNKCITAKNI